MGRKATVGPRTEHSQFARDITAYLASVRENTGLTGRGVAALGTERSVTWWSEIFNGKKILTTNDIAYIASLTDISPYEFVANARRLALGQPVAAVRFNVGPHPEAYEVSEAPAAELPKAAARKRSPEDKR